jgi:hypothetical protein
MSRTIKIENGQISIDPSTGLVETVTDNRKAAQDMAACLMQEYLADIDFGSYLTAVATNQIGGAGDLFIRYYVADAIQKLQAKQQQDPNLTLAEQITEITELLVKNDTENSITNFYVAVATADGGEAEMGAVRPTQLNHQFERF